MSGPSERLAAALADRYRVEREPGQGGMATVYLAQDIRHRRKVALKVFWPDLAAVIGAEWFLKEIEQVGGGVNLVGDPGLAHRVAGRTGTAGAERDGGLRAHGGARAGDPGQ